MTGMISSTVNPVVKRALALREQRERRASGLFLIEGAREIARAVSAGVGIETVLRTPGSPVTVPGARVVDVSERVFGRVALRAQSGTVAIARAFDTSLDDPPPGDLTILVADRIEKPGNLGAMIRAADATGAWVIVSDPATDVFNPNVVRASLGTLFTTPVRAGRADEVRAWLRVHGFSIWVTSPIGSVNLWEATEAAQTAVVIGAEDTGVDEAWMREADQIVKLPMVGAADSLNAAMTAGIVLYEIARRRA